MARDRERQGMRKRPAESVRDRWERQKMKETRRDRHRRRRQRQRKKAEEGQTGGPDGETQKQRPERQKEIEGEREHNRAENPVMEPRREDADKERMGARDRESWKTGAGGERRVQGRGVGRGSDAQRWKD